MPHDVSQAVVLPAGAVIWRASPIDVVEGSETQFDRYFSTFREECFPYLRQAENKSDEGGPWLNAFVSDRDMRILPLDDDSYDRFRLTRTDFLREIADAGFDAVVYGQGSEETPRPWDHVIMAREGILRLVSRASLVEVAEEQGWEFSAKTPSPSI